MKISYTFRQKPNKHTSVFSNEKYYPTNLEISLSLQGERAIENMEWGFLDLHYKLFDEFPECKRLILTYQDFLEGPFSLKINTGDLLWKFEFGAYFHDKYLPHVLKLDNLIQLEQPHICKSLKSDDLNEAILLGPTIDFVEKLRSIAPGKLHEIITEDIDALEARIDEASGRPFNFWALSDAIVKSAPFSDNPSKYLDLVAERYGTAYISGNERIYKS